MPFLGFVNDRKARKKRASNASRRKREKVDKNPIMETSKDPRYRCGKHARPFAAQMAMIGGTVVVVGVAVLLRDPALDGMM